MIEWNDNDVLYSINKDIPLGPEDNYTPINYNYAGPVRLTLGYHFTFLAPCVVPLKFHFLSILDLNCAITGISFHFKWREFYFWWSSSNLRNEESMTLTALFMNTELEISQLKLP